MNIQKKLQQAFFDNEENQYDQNLIIDTPPHTHREVNILIEKLVKSIGINDTVVDFGAGSGRLTIPLLKRGFPVLAIDMSKKSIDNLEKFVRKFSFISLKTAHNLPKDKNFIAITGTDILHHVDLDEYLPIIYKTLRRGGKVVFSEPGAFNPAWYIYLPLFSKWEIEKGIIYCSYSNLRKVFKKNGFQKIKITGLGFFPRPLFNWSEKLCKLNDRLGNLPFLKLFAYRYIIEASKS